MPVQWDLASSDAGNTSIELSADGAATSRLENVRATHGIFPWLGLDRNISNIRGATFDLHPLEDSDRLIATDSDDPSLPNELFPDRHVIAIRCTIEGPAMAWESLDGVILTPGQLAKLSPEYRRQLLAAGVTLAITGDKPSDDFPWQKTGRLWILSSGLSFPLPVNQDALTPTLGWVAGRSTAFRSRIVLDSLLFCFLLGGIALWKSRWMPVAVVLFCISYSTWIIRENQHQSPVSQAVGTVHVAAPFLATNDVWLFQQSHRDASFSIEIAGMIEPIFPDSAQIPESNLTLICDSTGEPRVLSGQLKADIPLAILSREFQPPENQSVVTPVTSPLRTLVTDSIYPGRVILEQINGVEDTDSPLRWPTIVLR
jgi:hypothetical protein